MFPSTHHLLEVEVDRIKERIGYGLLGASLGSAIALVGYWVLLPDVESLSPFLLLRAIVGAVVAMIVGPPIMNWKWRKQSR